MMKDPHNKLPIGTLDGIESYGWPELDDGIRHYVCILRSQGIETYESCQGGAGHCYPEPTVAFHGGKAEGMRAVAAALTYGLPVAELRRIWSVIDGELDGPQWAMTFRIRADVWQKQEDDRAVAVHKAMGKEAAIYPSTIVVGGPKLPSLFGETP
jgi:hypothetical protein